MSTNERFFKPRPVQLSPRNLRGLLDARAGVGFGCYAEPDFCCCGCVPVYCPVCSCPWETHREAVDCCLATDIDAHTRWAIADAVEAGSNWREQLVDPASPYGTLLALAEVPFEGPAL